MDRILHHLRNPRMMIPLYIPTNNGFPLFQSGAGFRPSTVSPPMRSTGESFGWDTGTARARDSAANSCAKACAACAEKTRLIRAPCLWRKVPSLPEIPLRTLVTFCLGPFYHFCWSIQEMSSLWCPCFPPVPLIFKLRGAGDALF